MQNIQNDLYDRLILSSREFLKDKGIKAHKFEKPMYPACVFYLGENSAGYYPEMNRDLIRGWGESAKHVLHYKVTQAGYFFSSLYDMDGNEKSVDDLRNELTEMMSSSIAFSDMNYIHFYFIINTDKVSPTDFRDWYLCMREIDDKILISKRTFFIAILNQSINNIIESEQIRQMLLELYVSSDFSKPQTHIYDSVFLFSNRLKNGQYIRINADSPEYSDYNLFADILLITNTAGAELNSRLMYLCDKSVPAFTAAYSNLSKPVNDIVMITLKKCLREIRRQIEGGGGGAVSADMMFGDLLGIENNRMPFADELYKKFVSEYVSNSAPLDHMPYEGSVRSMNFEKANDLTRGCLSLFIEQNYFEFIKNLFKTNASVIKEKLKSIIMDRMTFDIRNALQNFNGSIEACVKNEIGRLMIHADKKTTPVTDYISITCKNKLREYLVPVAAGVIADFKANSHESLMNFADLFMSVERMTSGSVISQNMNDFYERIVEDYYMRRERLEGVTKKLLSDCSCRDEMINVLFAELKNIFASAPVYTASFVDELIARIGSLGDGANVGALITNWLVQGLDNRVALNSYNTFNDRFFEVYFLNTMQETVFAALEEKSKSYKIPVSYYNTLSNDMVESVWFYKCTEDNVRI